MDTCGYDRMEEESLADNERHVVVYPMVTYNPETVESHPDLKAQRPRSTQQRLLRCMFLISLSNAIAAVVCMIFASIAKSMTGSNYEPCLTVCSMVLIESCLVWCLRYQGKKISQEGALESVWTSRIFFCSFVSVVVVAVCSVVMAGIAIYVLEHGELTDCYDAFNKIGNLEVNPCTGEIETRYFLSLLAVTLLAALGILSVLILGFSLRIARKFSLKLSTEADSSGVIVTQEDESGHKVIYRYKDRHVDSPDVGLDTDQQSNRG